MSEELTEKTPEVKEQPLPDLLKQTPNGPSAEMIEEWKISHGEVFVSGFSPEELFVWRTITRPEHVQLQTMAQNPENQITQLKYEELVCSMCVLFPTGPIDWDKGKGGTPSTLHEQIMQNSNFFSPQAASLLVAKL